MINKKEHDWNIEKEKLEIIILSEKLLFFDIEKKLKIITEEEINKLYELIKNENNLKKFFIILNNYRAT